jgi:hypothetical protein
MWFRDFEMNCLMRNEARETEHAASTGTTEWRLRLARPHRTCENFYLTGLELLELATALNSGPWPYLNR